MGTILKDFRYGVRQLARRPGFAAAAIASLAIGVGLNTTLFSVVNAVLLRGSPIAEPQRLVEIYSDLNKDYPQLTTSYPDYLDVRANVPALAGVAATSYVRGILSTGERPILVTGEAITSNYFDVLGIGLPLGRAFREEENTTPGAHPVAVLSHGLWQRRFGARPSVIGEAIELSGVDYTVVGVAPSRYTGSLPGIPTDFWVPIMMVERLDFSGVQTTQDNDPGATRLERRGTRWLFVKGRLADGRTIDEARAQIQTVFARNTAAYPNTNQTITASVLPVTSIRFHPMLDGYVRAASAVLLVAVSLVLMIACANVANMLIARGAARRREIAIRAAIGASRRRLLQQLLSEALVLAGLGGGLGVLIAWWAGRVLSGFGSEIFPVPISFEFSVDRSVLAFAVAASVGTAVLFGLAPAWSSSNPQLVPALKESAEGDGRRRTMLRSALVVTQLAMSLVLLVAGALLMRGLLTARDTDLGYDPTPLAAISFNLQMNGYDVERATALRDRALADLGALPGVVGVTTATRLPLSPEVNMDGILVPGRHARDIDATPVDRVAIGAGYFAVVGVPLVAGRDFTPDEVGQGRNVAIVNETMAKQFWPDGSAVGRLFHNAGFASAPFEIVGVARDHKVRSVGEPPRPYVHFPTGPRRSMNFIVRTSTPPATALPMLRGALWKLEPDIVFTTDVTAADVAATTIAPTRIGAMVLGGFGLLALALAAVGLYGVIAYSVSRRTREVGIRIALGAERSAVLRMVMAQGGRLALVGIGVGVLASAGVGQVLQSMLYGVSGFDPVSYGIAAGVLLVVAAAANLVPAFQASRIDPIRALRSE